MLTDLASARAAALLVKEPVATDPAVASAADAARVTLVEVGGGVAWEQLFLLLHRLLGPSKAQSADGEPGDLFQLANEIAALVAAPVTIEDPASRMLAFSGGQEDTDEGRVRTVLGREVPERYQERLAEWDVFGELETSSNPVFVPAVFPGHKPRMVVAVRAGTTILGYIWAVVQEPLSGIRLRAFRAAAEIVALHLLRERAVASAGSRLRAEQFEALLTNDGEVAEFAQRLGVLGLTVCVVAVELISGAAEAERAAELNRVSDALGLHLRLAHRATAVTTLGDIVYGLLPAVDEKAALRVIDEFVDRSGSRAPLRAGVGRLVGEPADVVLSRTDADDILRLLSPGDRPTASVRSVRTDLMVLRLADGIGGRELPEDSPVAVLLGHDAEHHANLVGTLAAYLDHFGDVGKAAAALHVHPNTFRYRLTRLSDIAGVDLRDPDVRLAAMIDLRLHGFRRNRR
ncbi:PucR family transcriptional regulator [Amycolatopsis rhizosphaerae]|uniref:PucR family transcriptional regulator n=1 Tax=Amycolatopsis rhizosphaerae TaxID=2053003 RepID=A0A558CYT5_9PSEU|nr:helix-turn-helix domain-containing protein [Amycolatopsis rhizosphaerae]TVT53941.1 PucR family transcriptional regulator [Amycolatopsis rhizosphaerae]